MKYFTYLLKAFKSTRADDFSDPAMAEPSRARPITIWLEKLAGHGEDAEPVVFISEDTKFGMAAVFDGLGGSGAGRFELSNESVTGARLAASLARKSVIETVRRVWLGTPAESQFPLTKQSETEAAEVEIDRQLPAALVAELIRRNIEIESIRREVAVVDAAASSHSETFGAFAGLPNPSLAAFESSTLARSFDSTFANAMDRLGAQAAGSRIKSRVKRQLPTTFAGGFYSEHEGKISLKVFWAGDSRIYFLCSRGLFQLTSDHARANSAGSFDPSGDAPLTRVVSELVPNEIDCCYETGISEPGFLIACTDGAYAYFPTAVHFELALWSALEMRVQAEQEKALEDSIAEVTQDDASLAMIPVGFRDRVSMTRGRRSELYALQKKFDYTVSALREVRPQIAKLEATVQKMRDDMQASPRASLGGSEAR